MGTVLRGQTHHNKAFSPSVLVKVRRPVAQHRFLYTILCVAFGGVGIYRTWLDEWVQENAPEWELT